MSGVTAPVPNEPSPRIGNAERQQAMDALDAHMSAGRLDPDEYGERAAMVSVARTAADLKPLFHDLPDPHPLVIPAFSSAPVPPDTYPSAPVGRRRDRDKHGHGEPLGGRLGEVVVGLSPFIALVLFFATNAMNFGYAWLFFLMIPAAGIIVYGPRKGEN
jgi:hypothetical protein